ncbi:MAG: hypothetical protein K2G03_06495 [Bacilli bacterium]|nr:hypothetical protein [Bacilli bacterium]
MSKFIYENVNPKNRKTDDCVVRAITKATGLSYQEIYAGLCSIGQKNCRMPNSKQTYEKLLEQLGYIKYPMPRHADNTRFKVYELVDQESDKTIIISMANHLTCAINGSIFDLWDCRAKSVGNYWIKK